MKAAASLAMLGLGSGPFSPAKFDIWLHCGIFWVEVLMYSAAVWSLYLIKINWTFPFDFVLLKANFPKYFHEFFPHLRYFDSLVKASVTFHQQKFSRCFEEREVGFVFIAHSEVVLYFIKEAEVNYQLQRPYIQLSKPCNSEINGFQLSKPQQHKQRSEQTDLYEETYALTEVLSFMSSHFLLFSLSQVWHLAVYFLAYEIFFPPFCDFSQPIASPHCPFSKTIWELDIAYVFYFLFLTCGLRNLINLIKTIQFNFTCLIWIMNWFDFTKGASETQNIFGALIVCIFS